MPIDKERVMNALRKHAPRALHAAEVCGRLGVSSRDKDDVLGALEELTELGLVTQMPGQRFRIKRSKDKRPQAIPERSIATKRAHGTRPRRSRNATSKDTHAGRGRGRMTMTVRGFGFVTTDEGGADVFIPPGAVGASMHGDLVEVEFRPSARGREGTVRHVVERRSPRITGVLRHVGRQTLIEPDDQRLRGPMPISGSVPRKAHTGTIFECDIVSFPQDPDDVATVRIVKPLGIAGSTEVEVAKVKIRESIIEEFPASAIREADEWGDRVRAADKRARKDLRSTPLLTIDPDDARDHDDALWAEKLPNGDVRAVIAIADVSFYVREGGAIDQEALSRGNSIYLPDRAIPMLPASLSSNLASLVPGKDRLCIALEVTIGSAGAVKSKTLVEGVMRSKARLTYRDVAETLRLLEPGPRKSKAERYRPILEALLQTARILRKKRIRRGALDFDLPEPKIRFDADGEPADVFRSRAEPGMKEAYGIVEEFMLLANEIVAETLMRKRLPGVFRAHGPPDERKLELFAELATSLGHPIDVEQAQNPRSLAKFLNRIEKSPKANVLRYLLLRAMQQAAYDTNPEVGHFALAAKTYLHFTSPIRRYADLAVHRVVRKLIRKEPIDAASLSPRLGSIAAETSRLERRAMVVERDVMNVYRAVLMRERIGEEFEARITGMNERALFATFDEPFVESVTPLERLADHFVLDRLGIKLSSERTGLNLSMGDRVTVCVEDVNLQRREIIALPTTVPIAATENHSDEQTLHPTNHRSTKKVAREKHHPKKNSARRSKYPKSRRQKSRDKKFSRRESRR